MQKDVVVVLLKLSRSSRAFIITQNGLPGFTIDKYTLPPLMSFHFSLSKPCNADIAQDLDQKEFVILDNRLKECQTQDQKEKALKSHHPEVYVDYLRATDRASEVEALYDESVCTGRTWYYIIKFKPKLA